MEDIFKFIRISIMLVLVVVAVIVISNRQDEANEQPKGETLKLYGKFAGVVTKTGLDCLVQVFGTSDDILSDVKDGSKKFQEGAKDTTKYGFSDGRELTLKDFGYEPSSTH